MVDRRSFLKGAAAGVVAAPAAGEELARMAQSAAGQNMSMSRPFPPSMPPSDVAAGYAAERALPPIPQEVWDLREQIEERNSTLDQSDVFPDAQIVTLEVNVLKSVKDSYKRIWITREVIRRRKLRQEERDSIFMRFSDMCEKFNLPNMFGTRKRKLVRDPRYW